MKAVVIATQGSTVLLPVAGRPFLHFVVESLVDAGVNQIDFVLSDLPEKVEASLGDGTRWGIRFRFHLARDAAHPYARLATLEGEDSLVLAHGDRLPLWTPGEVGLAYHEDAWTGWGVLPTVGLRSLPTDLDEAALASRLGCPRQDAPLMLSVRSYEDHLEANWAVLEKRFPTLMLTGREAAEGIWISRNVILHPTVRLTAPVHIGENCRINAGVQLGPRAVIANNCLIDKASTASETVIFAGSYVGEGLELNNAIVDRNRLVNVKVGAAITITDNFILGSFVESNLQHAVHRALSRISAFLLVLITLPLLLAAWLVAGCRVIRRAVVRLPVADEAEYRTYGLISFCRAKQCSGGAHQFFRHFLPGLFNVMGGQLSLVGVAPRTAEEIDALPHDWKQLYIGAKAGLITEAWVVHGDAPPADLLYSAEVFYAAMNGPRHDARLMAGYLARLLGSHT